MADNKQEKILVLGATGMLGHAVLRYFFERGRFQVTGAARSLNRARLLPSALQQKIVTGDEIENIENLKFLFANTRPDVVINCVGLVKQLSQANDVLAALPINSLLPHRIAQLCAVSGSRLIHISTDCVFSGREGMYCESAPPDARDLYGLSKFLGEVDYPHAVTLRTSMIGHELGTNHSLLEWFLSQTSDVLGYSKAVFSGLTTFELARVMHDFVIPNRTLRGMYHVSAAPIDKFRLLKSVAKVYEKTTAIIPDDKVTIDRSLNSTRFRSSTGYSPPCWRDMIVQMKEFH